MVAGRRIIGAGFALPRDAGRRPAVQAVAPLRDDQWTERLQARERPLHVLRGVVEVR